jgi:hypothetical protein
MEDRMKRTIEQWINCKPELMAKMSESAIMYALQDARSDIMRLHRAIQNTLADNGHLSDGDDCTLIDLKKAINAA